MTNHGIVSGFPRSGTSAVMHHLKKNGVPIFYQGEHADEFNPQGYFESPQIMSACISGNAEKMLDSLDGFTFKMPLPHHLQWLPQKNRQFFVIWLDREPLLSAISLRKLNFAKGAKFQSPVDELAKNIADLRAKSLDFLSSHPSFQVLRVPQQELDNHVSAIINHLHPVFTGKSPSLPSVHQILTRFGHAAHRFARSGFATTPPEILAQREATCRACDQWDAAALNSTGRCRKCGCSTWAKLRMATEACPLGKWTAVPPSNSPSAI